MNKPMHTLMTLALILGLASPVMLHGATPEEMQKRLELLEKLDQLDQADLDNTLEKAEECILRRHFNCARKHLEETEPFVTTESQERQVARTRQRLNREIALVKREEEKARQLAKKEERLEREERKREQAEYEAEQRRLAQQSNSSGDSSALWQGIMAFGDMYVESERIKNQQRAKQIAAQRQMRQDAERRQQQQQAQRAASQRDYQARQEAIQRQKQEAARARQQRIARQEQQRQARQEQQRQARQRQLERVAAATSNIASNTSSNSSTSDADDMGPQYSGKLYEPMMVTREGDNSTWFSDRDYALSLARLEAVNDIEDECRSRGARADGPTFSEIERGVVPVRWNYKTPDCKQGGWDDEEWMCTAEVSGTCYRNQ